MLKNFSLLRQLKYHRKSVEAYTSKFSLWVRIQLQKSYLKFGRLFIKLRTTMVLRGTITIPL